MRTKFRLILVIAVWATALPAQTNEDALLVVAHGAGTGTWNDRVVGMMKMVEWSGPKEAAFLTGRTPDEEFGAAVKRLDSTGVKRIVVVPFLVSSFSDHYEEIRYYTGDRKTAPDHHDHEPLRTRAELLLTSGMDADRLLGMILADQAIASSTAAGKESVILVAHGPNDDADDAKWLACLRVLAGFVQTAGGFHRVVAATIRDDAPETVKTAAVADLRARVKSYGEDTAVLIQPVLISSGHVQAEIVKLLEGLAFRMSASGVSNHPFAPEWIRQQATLRLRIASHLARKQHAEQEAQLW